MRVGPTKSSKILAALGAGLLLAATGCTAELKAPLNPSVGEFVTQVTTLDGTTAAVLRTGDRPLGGGGPTITVTGTPAGINGGSIQATITATTPFSRVVFSLEGFQDYFELSLPAAVTSVDLVLGLSQLLPSGSYAFLYGGAAAGGPLGAPVSRNVAIIGVATGDVQVIVSWDAASDVDLHVVDPAGEEIYFANLTSASGGTLDLDSNPACSIDNVNNENIVWPRGGAPSGTYSVALVYWSACSVPETNYVVTVQVVGQSPRVFSGTLTGPGSSSQQVPITTFTR